MHGVRAFLTLSFFLLCCASAQAHDARYEQPTVIVQQPVPYYPPYRPRGSILGFGFRGVMSGALAGLGASYFVAESGGDGSGVGITVASGALAGAALGLSLGVLDGLDFHSAYYISRDLSYGVLFGAAAGALAGCIVALNGGDEEAVLYGAAAGSLAGVPLGLLSGVIEGQVRRRRHESYYGARQLSVSVAQLEPETRTRGARLAGRF
jgi:hypothetical protein